MSSSVPDIFARALEQPARRREEFVARCTRSRPEARREVKSLLRAHGALGTFLDGDDRLETVEPTSDSVRDHELIRKLGEGGFGTVHLARELGPLRREVAVKFLKPDRLHPNTMQRFDTERRVLANLQHDAIAKIHSAGTTAAGCPYYTMEYVAGLPLDSYCDSVRCSVDERVDLMLPVARAVAHAHGRGVIHGDIKPNNVLVCAAGGAPSPKVIDFGIARVLGDAGGATTPLGTPRYMSPEQRAGGALDTRSDVFALGVLLHDLIMGSTSRDGTNSSLVATFDAMDEASRVRVAESCLVSPKRLRGGLRQDLDDIVKKATHNDAEERYETVREFIADLEACRAHRPLPSRPRSVLYDVRCFLRRHGLFSLVVGLLAATGLVLTLRTHHLDRVADDAHRASRSAREDAQSWGFAASQALDVLDEVFHSASPNQRGPDVSLLEVVDAAERRFEDSDRTLPVVSARIALSLGRLRIELEQYEEAERLLRRSLSCLESMDAPPRQALGHVRLELANTLGHARHTPESRGLIRLARKDFVASNDREGRLRAQWQLNVADLVDGLRDPAIEGLRATYREAVVDLGPDHAATLEMAICLAGTERTHGDAEAARRLRAKLGSGQGKRRFQATVRLDIETAEFLCDEGRLDEAGVLAEEILSKLSKGGLGRDSTYGEDALGVLALIASREGDEPRALVLTREIHASRGRRLGASARGTLRAAGDVATTLLRMNRPDDARRFIDGLNGFAADQPCTPHTIRLFNAEAALLQRDGRIDEALAMHDRIVESCESFWGKDQTTAWIARRCRGSALAKCGRLKESLADFLVVSERTEARLGPGHIESVLSSGLVARALNELGRVDDAAKLLEERLGAALSANGPAHITVKLALTDLGGFAKHSGRYDELERSRDLVEDAFEFLLDGGRDDAEFLAAWQAFEASLD